MRSQRDDVRTIAGLTDGNYNFLQTLLTPCTFLPLTAVWLSSLFAASAFAFATAGCIFLFIRGVSEGACRFPVLLKFIDTVACGQERSVRILLKVYAPHLLLLHTALHYRKLPTLLSPTARLANLLSLVCHILL